MKNATKLIAALLMLVMIFSLGACAAKTEPSPSASTEASPSTAASPSADTSNNLKILDTAYTEEDYAICVAKGSPLLDKINTALKELTDDGSLQKIVDKYISGKDSGLTFQQSTDGLPELTMATNAAFPPYEFYESDKVVGIDAEVAAAIADKLGMKLVIEDMEFGSIIAAVTSGKVDMGMAGMTVTDERKQSVDFSTTYAKGIQSIVVKEGSPITSVGDLSAEGAKYMVGVQQDTTGDIYATGDFGDARIQRFNKGADAIQALLTGKVDCVIIDNEPAKAFVEANNK
jgi:polar amino acid transport system substrate-binding protein